MNLADLTHETIISARFDNVKDGPRTRPALVLELYRTKRPVAFIGSLEQGAGAVFGPYPVDERGRIEST